MNPTCIFAQKVIALQAVTYLMKDCYSPASFENVFKIGNVEIKDGGNHSKTEHGPLISPVIALLETSMHLPTNFTCDAYSINNTGDSFYGVRKSKFINRRSFGSTINFSPEEYCAILRPKRSSGNYLKKIIQSNSFNLSNEYLKEDSSLVPFPLTSAAHNKSICDRFMFENYLSTILYGTVVTPLNVEAIGNSFLNSDLNYLIYYFLHRFCDSPSVKANFFEAFKLKLRSTVIPKPLRIENKSAKPCSDLLNGLSISATPIDILNSSFCPFSPACTIWFPVITECDSKQCSSILSVFQCSNFIRGVQGRLSTDILSDKLSTDIDVFSDLRFLLIPTLLWSCPIIYKRNLLGGEVLGNLWLVQETLPQFCEKLLCNATIYYTEELLLSYIVTVTEKDQYQKCHQFSLKQSNFKDDTMIFSFEVPSSFMSISFVVSKNQKENYQKAKYLALLHRVDNKNIKNCCDYDSLLHIEHNRKYFTLCYGTSISCYSMEDLWVTEKLSPYRYIILMRKDIAHLKLFRWLAVVYSQSSLTALQLPLSKTCLDSALHALSPKSFDISSIGSLKFHNISFEGYDIIVVEGNTRDKEHLVRIFEIYFSGEDLNCNEGEFYSLCYTNSVCLLYSHNCSLGYLGKDKAVLLFLNHFHDTGISVEHLCRNNTVVLKTSIDVFEPGYNCQNVKYQPMSLCWHMSKSINTTTENRILCEFTKNSQMGTLIDKYKVEKIHYFFVFQMGGKCEPQQNRPIELNHHQLIPKSEPLKNVITEITVTHDDPLALTEIIKHRNDSELLAFREEAKLFALIYMNRKYECIRDIFPQKFSIRYYGLEHKILQAVVGPTIPNNDKVALCISKFNFFVYEIRFRARNLSINKFWPSCFYNMALFFKSSSLENFVLDWDYLPENCKSNERALFFFSTFLTVINICGNTFVLFIIIASDLIKKRSFLIRFNLSLADLLMGILPGSLALHDFLSLMKGTLTFTDLDNDLMFANYNVLKSEQTLGFQQLRFRRSGFPVATSIIMNVSVYVSLFTIALLSVANIRVMLGKPLSRRMIKVLIGITWFLGVSLSLLVNWRDDGFSFSGFFDPVTKLTINIGSGEASVSSVSWYMQILFIALAALTVIILTIASVILFYQIELKAQDSLTIHQLPRRENAKHTIITLVCMVLLFMVAIIPLLLDIWLDLIDSNPIAHFFAWWIFMAAASWNWVLYSLIGTKFREKICITIKYMLGLSKKEPTTEER